MNIVFMGTPDFSVPCLNRLIDDGHKILGVFTQPDRPKGRGHKMTFSAIKEVAVAAGIDVYQPNKIKEAEQVEILKALAPDIIVVVAFGQILSQAILDIPRYGCINVHASLLPKYRGAAPINWAILNGEQKTGITTMYMAKGLDTGDMILKKELELSGDETAISLFSSLSIIGAQTLHETINLIETGKAMREVQDEAQTCYSPMLTKEQGKIDWQDSAGHIKRQTMGLIPWPCAYTSLDGKNVKIYVANVVDNDTDENLQAGEIYRVLPDCLYIKCGQGSIAITEFQFENEKRMTVAAYSKGHKIEVGQVFGK